MPPRPHLPQARPRTSSSYQGWGGGNTSPRPLQGPPSRGKLLLLHLSEGYGGSAPGQVLGEGCMASQQRTRIPWGGVRGPPTTGSLETPNPRPTELSADTAVLANSSRGLTHRALITPMLPGSCPSSLLAVHTPTRARPSATDAPCPPCHLDKGIATSLEAQVARKFSPPLSPELRPGAARKVLASGPKGSCPQHDWLRPQLLGPGTILLHSQPYWAGSGKPGSDHLKYPSPLGQGHPPGLSRGESPSG